jgi:hypothetical protein
MTLPTLTPEQRTAALAKAAEVRTARAEIKAQLKTGRTSIADLLNAADLDPVVGKMRVSTVLESLPKIGKTKAEQIMAELEISPVRRMKGLGDRQRDALLERFGYTHSLMTMPRSRPRPPGHLTYPRKEWS